MSGPGPVQVVMFMSPDTSVEALESRFIWDFAAVADRKCAEQGVVRIGEPRVSFPDDHVGGVDVPADVMAVALTWDTEPIS